MCFLIIGMMILTNTDPSPEQPFQEEPKVHPVPQLFSLPSTYLSILDEANNLSTSSFKNGMRGYKEM